MVAYLLIDLPKCVFDPWKLPLVKLVEACKQGRKESDKMMTESVTAPWQGPVRVREPRSCRHPDMGERSCRDPDMGARRGIPF